MLLIKALHIVGGISWFAGLIYLGRLFIYDAIAMAEDEPKQGILHDQLLLMAQRVWIYICMPAMLFTLVAGSYTVWILKAYLQPWFHVKALFIVFLLGYQVTCSKYLGLMKDKKIQVTDQKRLRIFNELLTLIIVGIVVIAVTRQAIDILWAILTIMAVVALIAVFFKWRRSRSRS